MSVEDAQPSQSGRSIEDVLQAAREIPHTDYIVGRGTRKPDGGIHIVEYHVSRGLGERFVKAYPEYEAFDSAAQQFLCAPFLSITIEVGVTCYVDDTSKQSAKMNDYLRLFDVDSLLLVGLESSMGLCWMTLYRRLQPKEPFTAEQAELASYRVRAALFEWQLRTKSPIERPPPPERYKLLPLGRRCLDVAVRRMRGIPRKRIATELGMTEDGVDAQTRRLKELKLSNQKLMEQFFGELPPPRPLPPNDPEAQS
ncbi:hypothetical protein SNE35_29930 [Paucibacter sp. R3-3]|uniref:HTH luxR-type domain-containing protein n=1 Tax=Roseateles agri TaxID=3098619 RepID=A0ABU5DSK6_9BURK|nr:hypothetical protein [Paucibacter sp. R3-3]MDY0748756.1 hypothetical protein [Paucibacter sp. R3-3]